MERVVFVSDFFSDELVGGAELTSEALIKSCPFDVVKVKSSSLTMNLLEKHKDDFWIFGNWTMMNAGLIPAIVANMKYSIIEFDYKFCSYRSTAKHQALTGLPCDCHNGMSGKMVSAFYHAAKSLWWMSEKQMDKFHTLFPFLADNENIVLSSVFDDETLLKLKMLKEINDSTKKERRGWIVLDSTSWVKGTQNALRWCRENNVESIVIGNVPYDQMLATLAGAEGLVYLPSGADTCPRLVIEAKLLGCKLVLNDDVQHKDESWFNTEDFDETYEYLYSNKKFFWDGITASMNKRPTISGYMTTYNCLKQGYPFREAIASMVQFCDEVCIVDGGSTDGTWEALEELRSTFSLMSDRRGMCDIVVKQIARDWNDSRFAVFDGLQKAEARRMCTKDFCWQMDSDEIVHEDDVAKILHLADKLPNDVDIVSLPVIEYWGSTGKVRMDINPAKWRLSRNKPSITHGIPAQFRRFDNEGKLYAANGTDGCCMIDATTFQQLPHMSFMSPDMYNIQCSALDGNEVAREQWEKLFNNIVTTLPCVHHYSWWNIERKIKLYRDTWTKHWASLYNKQPENCFFDVDWKDVTDDMISNLAKDLEEKTGGHVFHSPWRGNSTPSVKVTVTHPKFVDTRTVMR